MATIDTKNDPFEQLDKVIEELKERGKRLRERKIEAKPIQKVDKKKEVKQVKNKYTNYFKAASIFAFLGVIFVVYTMSEWPNVYNAVMVFFEALNPFSFDSSTGSDFYVN